MMKSKKGLSGIVMTLIMILLVLVAIGIVWVAVKSLLDKGVEQIEGGTECLTLKMSVESASYVDPDAVSANGDEYYSVVIQRGADSVSGEITDVKVVFTDADGTDTVDETGLSLKALEKTTLTVTSADTDPTNSVTVAVAAVFGTNPCPASTAVNVANTGP